MSLERLGLSKSLLKLDDNSFLKPRMVLRDDQDPVQIRIKVKKPNKTKSTERPVCFRVKDGRPVDPSSICAPVKISSKPRVCAPLEPAYEVAPVVYLNADGTSKGCAPTDENLKDPDCGCPVESSVEKTFTQEGSEDEPLVIRIGPTGDFSDNGCEEKPVYKINFKDNVMNVTSNIDFLVKKMERTKSTDEKDPDAQKYLIKPISKKFPPVTVTVRPNPVGNQTVTVNQTTEESSSSRSQSVPNEYAEQPSRTVQPTIAPQQQGLYTPEQLAAAYQQQQAVNYQQQPGAVVPQQAIAYQQQPGAAATQQAIAYQQQPGAVPPQQIVLQTQAAQQAVAAAQQGHFTPEQIMAAVREQQASNPGAVQFTPEQLAAAYREQQSGQAEFKVSPEQLAAAYKEQQAANPGAPQYQFTPEQLAAAYQQQQGGLPPQPQQQQAPTQYAQPQQQAPAPTQYAQPGAQPQAYAYPQQQQAPAPTQYAQQAAYPQQQQAPAPTQYAQPGAQPKAYAYPQQQQAPAPTQYAQQPGQQPFQFSQFPPQVAA